LGPHRNGDRTNSGGKKKGCTKVKTFENAPREASKKEGNKSARRLGDSTFTFKVKRWAERGTGKEEGGGGEGLKNASTAA